MQPSDRMLNAVPACCLLASISEEVLVLLGVLWYEKQGLKTTQNLSNLPQTLFSSLGILPTICLSDVCERIAVKLAAFNI